MRLCACVRAQTCARANVSALMHRGTCIVEHASCDACGTRAGACLAHAGIARGRAWACVYVYAYVRKAHVCGHVRAHVRVRAYVGVCECVCMQMRML